ncbi:MAG: LPO_1073/Vpar_1526 family protein [Promethearchaeota archaeon]
MEPISTIIISATVGAASSKFIDKAWDSGEKWIKAYLKNHRPKSIEKGYNNAKSFLNILAQKIDQIYKNELITEEELNNALEHPDFSVFLQKAILSSIQTENVQKYNLLARLVSDRLRSNPESTHALASKMACDAISYANQRQLKILGLTTNIISLKPTGLPDKSKIQSFGMEYLSKRLKPYINLQVSHVDLVHLEAISCVKYISILSQNIDNSIRKKFDNNFNTDEFKNSEIGEYIYKLWNHNGLEYLTLTSIGLIIGVMVSDLLSGSKTEVIGWE